MTGTTLTNRPLTYQSPAARYTEKPPRHARQSRYERFAGPEWEYSEPTDSRFGAMRVLPALLFILLLAGCSKPAPPTGRWEGAFDDGTTFIAARLEIGPGGQVRVSAPDVVDSSIANDEDRAAMRQNMAARLAGAWGEVAPRPMDFDGTTFRKPGGIAPQIDWDAKTNAMTLYVYLGTRPAIRIPLHAVGDFSDNPWGS
jgi:hypothetical protein